MPVPTVTYGVTEDGRARAREVKPAVFFTQDKLDDEGYPVRDPESSSYLATFEPAATFADLVEAEGIRRGAHHIRQFTIVGDGAAWIWDIATGKFPRPPRSPVSGMPAGTSTTSPASWSSCSATSATNGPPPAWTTSTTATSTASAPPPMPLPLPASRKRR